MDVFQKEGVEQLRVAAWENKYPSLCAGMTTRNGGNSTGFYGTLNMGLHVSDDYECVMDNRNHLANLIHFPVENWVSGEQVHQTHIHNVQTADKGKGAATLETSIPQTDGLITNEIGILNTSFFADCVPLFFFDPTSGYIGLAHAGWKGTVGRIAEKMVQQLTAEGADISTLLVAIGPSISGDFYEVDDYVTSHVDENLAKSAVQKKRNNRYLLDLKQLNKHILIEAGVHAAHIEVSEYCTYKDEDVFYSHRRDHGKTGRMLGFIGFQS